ncbi:MAG: Na+/H+ antiporter subunit D, partial [Mesorhizobium sp.]
AGSALGVVFAGDYLTLFLFWEAMAFASAYLVFAQRGEQAIRAAFRYLMVHITGGVALLGGVILHGLATGSLLF